MRAEGLDRVADHDGALVDRLTGDGGDRLSDVTDGDGAEETTLLAGPDLELDRTGLELGLDLAGVVGVAQGAGRTSRLDRLDLLLGAAGPTDRVAPRDEVVAGVASLTSTMSPGEPRPVTSWVRMILVAMCQLLSQRPVEV